MRTNIFLKIGIWIYGIVSLVLPGHYRDAKAGSLSQTWCATAPKEDLVNGAFYRPVGVRNGGSGWARDEGLQKMLWEWTEAEFERFGY